MLNYISQRKCLNGKHECNAKGSMQGMN